MTPLTSFMGTERAENIRAHTTYRFDQLVENFLTLAIGQLRKVLKKNRQIVISVDETLFANLPGTRFGGENAPVVVISKSDKPKKKGLLCYTAAVHVRTRDKTGKAVYGSHTLAISPHLAISKLDRTHLLQDDTIYQANIVNSPTDHLCDLMDQLLDAGIPKQDTLVVAGAAFDTSGAIDYFTDQNMDFILSCAPNKPDGDVWSTWLEHDENRRCVAAENSHLHYSSYRASHNQTIRLVTNVLSKEVLNVNEVYQAQAREIVEADDPMLSSNDSQSSSGSSPSSVSHLAHESLGFTEDNLYRSRVATVLPTLARPIANTCHQVYKNHSNGTVSDINLAKFHSKVGTHNWYWKFLQLHVGYLLANHHTLENVCIHTTRDDYRIAFVKASVSHMQSEMKPNRGRKRKAEDECVYYRDGRPHVGLVRRKLQANLSSTLSDDDLVSLDEEGN